MKYVYCFALDFTLKYYLTYIMENMYTMCIFYDTMLSKKTHHLRHFTVINYLYIKLKGAL